jgi:Transposase DDE domain
MARKKAVYRPRNWAEYNKSLVGRGSLTLWVSEEVLEVWYSKEKTGQKGASNRYSALAILCAKQVRFLYHLPLRATQGFSGSLFALLKIELEVPWYTMLSRRLKNLDLPILKTPSKEPRHLVLDSTGLKVYGEGEWKVRVHGWSKRRAWLKYILALMLRLKKLFVAC